MSDFDKEAEREKLRKKYERDEADREATQRMSDLLLKGATMTNTHCGTCGDPLFSQNGVNFCPSCHGGPQGVEASIPDERQDQGQSPDSGAEPAGNSSAPATDSSALTTPESQPDSEPTDLDVTPTTDDGSSAPERSPASVPTDTAPPARTPPAPATGSDAGTGTTSAGTTPSLESARGSLHQALERFAAEAASTDDPRYATECLEAAHEAAQALSALRR